MNWIALLGGAIPALVLAFGAKWLFMVGARGETEKRKAGQAPEARDAKIAGARPMTTANKAIH